MPDSVHPMLAAFHDQLIDGLEFCRLTYSTFEALREQPDATRVIRERRGPIKQLLEELFPICRYIQTFYAPGQYISVRWVKGIQSYDAKVESKGFMVEHGGWRHQGTLEVTQAVHDKAHLMRELLNTKGSAFGVNGLSVGKGKRNAREITSEPLGYTNQSYIGEMCAIIVRAIDLKIEKLKHGNYPDDTTLIVDCELTTIFWPSEWDKLVAMVKAEVYQHGFVRIFLTAEQGGHIASL